MSTAPRFTRAELEAELAQQKRRGKPFARLWLDATALPPLPANDGAPLSVAAVLAVCDAQARYKAMHAAPENVHWLQVVDRTQAGTFALALLQQWLASEQDSKDRWALVLAGVLGDDRIATALLPHVQPWCEAARHKLAENAAHAIALLGSDLSLMVLDTLRTRYRNKFRNIGAAANAAFQAAAQTRGISDDELGDLVMPRFSFDADGRRPFEWAGGGVLVELGSDGKLGYWSLDGEKRSKSLPAGTPAEVQAAIKELQKQLREARKAQALRLELGLVRQRRWSAARFDELFLQHGFGRSLVAGLVFGVYDPRGERLRCCRRYHNGVLADAAGRSEELAEPGLQLGLVHPLELSATELQTWREHLQRQKAEPLFVQLDRPVVRVEPAHHNRRELQLCHGRTLAAGTFRGRAERRGWQRGSVADAGGVASYWKDFPGCGLEVVLELDGMYVGIDPMATVTLGTVRFVRSGSVQRGSYVYDDPKQDDERVVPFGKVPPIVYSETTGDLLAMLGEGASGSA